MKKVKSHVRLTDKDKSKNLYVLEDRCDLCGTCLAVCPPNVMSILTDHLIIDLDKCTFCELCYYICPIRAIESSCN
ncbi:DUF362 domain-containing protein [candidate division KSB1 bacterium]